MDKKTIITLAENCPPVSEEQERRKQNLCLYSELNNGEWEFCCSNKVHEPIISKSICICNEHISLLNKKYEIDIKKELIKKNNDYKTNNFYKPEDLFNSIFIKSIYENLSVNEFTLFSYSTNPEKCWFLNIYFLIGLPANWFNELIYFDSSLKGSKKQGKNNGPDFIFQNINNKNLIGFEIVSWNWNISDQFKNKEAAMEFHKKLYDYALLDDYIKDMEKMVKNKSDKAIKYKECSFLYLGIVVGNTILDYQYYVIECVLNKFVQKNQLKFSEVFIL